MSAASKIDPTSVERLRKIWALASSPNVGEAVAARDRATAFLARYGKTIADIPDLLAVKVEAPEPNIFGFKGFDDWMEEKEPGHKARARKERSEEERRRAAYRAEVIRKYGSKDAAVAPTPMEQTVDDAVAPFKRREPKAFANGVFECETLDGWSDMLGESLPDHVRSVIEKAIVLPTTIQEAKAEFDLWEARHLEIEAAYGYTGADCYLSLACAARREICRKLLETGLRAQSIADVLVRQRHLVNGEYSMLEVEQAVLADLEHLAAMAGSMPEPSVQFGHVHNGQNRTATDRRREVIQVLSNVDTAGLSDREIARMVGVSPQTVGNIRRKHATAATG